MALLVAIARAVARLEIDHAHARPVGRALAELVVGPHLQEGHRHPLVEKGRQRILGGDHEVGRGGDRSRPPRTGRAPRRSRAAPGRRRPWWPRRHGSPIRALSGARGRSRSRGTEYPNGRSASSGWDSSAGGQGRSCQVKMCHKSKESTAELDVVAALVTRLTSGALGDAVLADLAVYRITGIGLAVGALGIGLFLDHELGTVPARLGRRLAGRAVLLHEGHLALA